MIDPPEVPGRNFRRVVERVNHMKKKTRGKTIQRELFWSYSALIILVLTLCIGTFFAVFLTQIARRMEEYNLSLCYRLAMQLNDEVERMDEVAQRIIFSPEVKELFCQKFSSEQDEELYDNELELAELLSTFIGPTYRLARINLFSDGVRYLSVKGYASVQELPPQEISWTPKAYAGNRILLSPSMKGDGFTTFSLIRDLALPAYFQENGYVEIQQNYAVFSSIIDNTQAGFTAFENMKNRPSVYVFTAQGDLVYPYGGGDQAEYCLGLTREMAENPDMAPSRLRIEPGHLELYSCVKMQNTDWFVVMVDGQSFLDRSITFYVFGILIGGALMLLLALVISYWISRRITKPISQVHRQIQSMNPVTLVTTAPELSGENFNEIQQLNFAFKNLCDELGKSADEAATTRAYLLQAKLQALQSQMNPHFLYNTLSAIGIMAEEEGAMQSMDMILALSDMLNYVSGGDMSPVELRTEVEYTQNFLSLLKIRFEDQVMVSISIPDPLMEIRVPKLILEPLVENWSKYGMSGTGQSRLSIKGAVSGGRWSITVTDNGPGFSQEIMEELTSKMDGVVREGKIPDLHIHKMGLLNIFIRLHYAYGKECIFQVENTPQGSGQVTIGGSYHVDESAH